MPSGFGLGRRRGQTLLSSWFRDPPERSTMHRRSFLKAGGAISLAAGLGAEKLLAHVPIHNFDKYDFGSGPQAADRLYQGPFSADDYPSWNVVMALTPS